MCGQVDPPTEKLCKYCNDRIRLMCQSEGTLPDGQVATILRETRGRERARLVKNLAQKMEPGQMDLKFKMKGLKREVKDLK